jgi:putative membrane-bound dehydrogenase-like protein
MTQQQGLAMFRLSTVICRFGLLALVAAHVSCADEPEKLDQLLPRIPAREPDQAAQSFEVTDGFSMRLVAHEPAVVDPVDAAFDADGRLWVLEMRGYPFPEEDAEPLGRVRLLIDTTGDGIFDKSVIVADKLPWPTGIALWRGGCFVIAAPDLWYFSGVGDPAEGSLFYPSKVFTGFERANVQALANNLKWGVDGKIYGASSLNGGAITPAEKHDASPVSIRGSDFRFDPWTRSFEAISGTAQFGQSFNNAYDRFLCSNSNHAVHVVLDSKYLARNPMHSDIGVLESIAVDGAAAPVFRKSQAEPWRLLRTARRAASGQSFAATELHATGYFTSASGITIYRGDAYPKEFLGNLFVGDVGGNLIHRKRLEPIGPTYKAIRLQDGVEFVASTDNWFRPVNFVNGPDGCLYILDMYRETIEHPWSIPEDIKAHLDLRSGQDRGRIYRLEPPGFQRRPTPTLSTYATSDLVPLLGHPNAWHRETAHRLLLERREVGIDHTLRSFIRESQNKSELGELHALGILHALQLTRRDDYQRALGSPSPVVRKQALAWAEKLLPGDPPLQRLLSSLADDPDPRVRWQVALSAGSLDPADRVPILAKLAERDGKDPWMRAALLCSSSRAGGRLLLALRENTSSAVADLCAAWARQVGADAQEEELTALAQRLVERDQLDADSVRLLAGLADGLMRAGGSTTLWKRITVKETAESLQARLSQLAEIATNDQADPSQRADAVRAMELNPESESATFASLLQTLMPQTVQLAALAALGRRDEPAIGDSLLRAWPSATTTVKSEMIEILMSRSAWHPAVMSALEAGTMSLGQISASARNRLLASTAPGVTDRIRAMIEKATANRRSVLDAYRKVDRSTVDLVVGKRVFERECATCHKLHGVGHEVGPNLATITGRSFDQMVEHILDPNLEILPSYWEYAVVLADGRSASGLIAAETAAGITLKRAEGVIQSLARDEIDEIKSTGKSLMPEGLEQKISPPEMASLIAYLQQSTDTSKLTGSRK